MANHDTDRRQFIKGGALLGTGLVAGQALASKRQPETSNPVLRIHPAIGLARVGNSDEYVLAPETGAGMDLPGTDLLGGLPIQPGTEAEPITNRDLRDKDGALKRHAQRFRIYQYRDPELATSYPYRGKVEEIVIGSRVDFGDGAEPKTVREIVWTVHLANKKANCWVLEEDNLPSGVISSLSTYGQGALPRLRNATFAGTADPSDPARLRDLVVDAGPRTIAGKYAARIDFDRKTTPSYYQRGAGVRPLPDYPVSFPEDHFDRLDSPSGTPVRHLGAIETDGDGRLIVLGGEGTASGWYQDENRDDSDQDEPFRLTDDVNNDGWFDDTADGPVSATLIFTDGSTLELENQAWVVSTDPSYAPQIRNVVSLWDDVYDTWLHCFDLDPTIYSGSCEARDASGYNKGYSPHWDRDVFPMFRAASLQMFTANLNSTAIQAHRRLDQLLCTADPRRFLRVRSLIRSPYPHENQLEDGSPRMPLAMGEPGASFLTLTKTQYYFLSQWFDKKYSCQPAIPLTAGERLDKNVLTTGLGGRFGPGIDLTFIVRDPALYNPDWRDPDIGPFRFNAAPLDYLSASKNQPFLGVGYTPLRRGANVEPGDVCKFMAIPWHTDYNSCATHLPSPNPGGDVSDPSQIYDGRNTTLFWSWPAQRPVAVYRYRDLLAAGGELPRQRFSVRGEGTQAPLGPNDDGVYDTAPDGTGTGPDDSFFQAQQVGRFQARRAILDKWQNIGTVIQGPQIEHYPLTFDRRYFLEVESRMSDVSDVVEPWPNTLTDTVVPIPNRPRGDG